MKLSPIKNAIQVVCALLIRENKLLLGLRPPQKHLADHWELPGGKVENGETFEDALQRELKEELNITIEKDQCTYLTSVVHTYPEKTIELHVLKVGSYSGALKNLEHSQLDFFELKLALDQNLGKADRLLLERPEISVLFQ